MYGKYIWHTIAIEAYIGKHWYIVSISMEDIYAYRACLRPVFEGKYHILFFH